MLKVDSKRTLRDVSKGLMRMNRGRNVIAFLAVILTTVMFTTLFTSVFSMVKSQQYQEMREYYNTAHIGIQFTTREQFEQVIQDPIVKEYGYSIFMGVAENEELMDYTTEVKYADLKGAESMMCAPTIGGMPEAYDEVAMSTVTMDALGIPHEVGSRVQLTLTLNGETRSYDFVLSGFWKGDTLGNWQEVWLSEAFCMDHAKEATIEALEKDDAEGGYQIRIWCGMPFGLQKKADELEEKYGFSGTAVQVMVNPAWDIFAEDHFPFEDVIAILVVIFASGYLIVFNVFYLSVNNDIRIYGLLKNVGATGKQLKKIVRRQAFLLSFCGIPIGLLLGYLVGARLTPYLLSGSSTGEEIRLLLSTNPLIFVGAVLFVLLTVYAGCIKPCRIVSSISPVEAVRMTEGELPGQKHSRAFGAFPMRRHYKNSQKTGRTPGKITPSGMACGNARRSWKKAVLVVISISLPVMVLNAAWSVFRGFDFEMYLDTYCTYDFDISYLTAIRSRFSLDAVTTQVQKALEDNEYVEKTALIYCSDTTHELSDVGCEHLKTIMEEARQSHSISESDLEEEAHLLTDRQVVTHIMGINEAVFEKMTLLDGACTYGEFAGGDSVIVEVNRRSQSQFYNPGDTVKLRFENEREKEYTVAAVAVVPFDLGFPYASGTWFDYTFYLPEQEYLSMEEKEDAMMAGVEVKEGCEKKFSRWLEEYISDGEKSLLVESRMALMNSCRGYAQRYYVILGLMCVVLFVICLLNFFNTSAMTILARSRELSLLEAVGMTQRQLKQMLISENILYLTTAVLLADTAGTALAGRVIEKTVGRVFFFNCHMSVLPSLAVLPVLAVVSAAIPIYNYRKLRKKTVMERLQRE